MVYKFKRSKSVSYPGEAFDKFGCLLLGELCVIAGQSNSGKTTFGMNIIRSNLNNGIKGYYINLEFPIEQVPLRRWLRENHKEKQDLSKLTDREIESLERFVNQELEQFEYYNNPEGIDLETLNTLIWTKAAEGYNLFLIDTFSQIQGNYGKEANESQYNTIRKLQELAQENNICIIVLHHLNKQRDFSGSQKIMDLSNVFIKMTTEEYTEDSTYTQYELIKDKYVNNTQLDIMYDRGSYKILKF